MTPASAMPSKNFLRQPEFLAAAGITLVIVAFHFYFLLHAGGFWRDEVNLLNVANQNSLSGLAHDSFPVLMPLLVKIWYAIGLGSADVNLRMLGVFVGLGSVTALWVAGMAARRTPPVVALVLFTLNSTVISYGDELRAYGLGSLTTALLFAAAVFLLKQPDWKRAGVFALCAILSVQSLFHNAVLVGAICLGAIAVYIRNKNFPAALKVFIGGLCAAISLLPYSHNFISGRETTVVLRTGFSWTKFFGELKTAVGFPLAQFEWLWVLLALLAIFLAIKVLFRKTEAKVPEENCSDSDLRLLTGATIFFALAGFLGFLQFTALPGQPWYFLPLMILMAIGFDVTLATFQNKTKFLVLILALVTFFISLPFTKADLNYRFTNIDTWAVALSGEAKPNDYIVVSPWFTGITFAHYFHGAAGWNTLPPLPRHNDHCYDLVQGQMNTTNALAPVLEQITTALRGGHRVWFLCPADFVKASLGMSAPPPDLPAPPLPQTGWLDEPYSGMWTGQTIYFLAHHAKSFNEASNPDSARRTGENSGLFMIEGWKDEASGTP
ncbi:MAG TPA: hypothetical protein VK742_13335 [Candidatus Sulfotelmatobacter sp.]|nr:hypothetical protein [Candidatus Sulfotelmatobacter sp.]